MNVARDLKLHYLFLFFLLLSRKNIGSKTFLGSLCKVLLLCDFLDWGCLRIFCDVSATISHSVSIFVLNASYGTFQFCFSHNENIGGFTIN